MLTRALALALSVASFACASEGGAFAHGDEPGTGTSTLTVIATAYATPRVTNAASDDDYDTAFRVVIDKGAARVVEGSVTITSARGALELTLDTREGGVWMGSQPSYREVYLLDIVSGADRVDGVRIDGPDRHRFTAPVEGSTVDAQAPLTLAWSRLDTATTATLSTSLLTQEVPDTGSFALAAEALANAPDRVVAETVRLERASVVIPAGALIGSSFTATVLNTLKLSVAPTAGE